MGERITALNGKGNELSGLEPQRKGGAKQSIAEAVTKSKGTAENISETKCQGVMLRFSKKSKGKEGRGFGQLSNGEEAMSIEKHSKGIAPLRLAPLRQS